MNLTPRLMTLGGAVVLVLAASAGLVSSAFRSPPADAVISVDAGAAVGSLSTRLGTQIVWTNALDQSDDSRARFNSLAPPLVRINATAGPTGYPLVMPAGTRRGDWGFAPLDSIVGNIRGAGAEVVLTIAYAPRWMWRCPDTTPRDPTFGEFGDYMARLVSYYNLGSFVAEDGRSIKNPSGTAHRITYWELWNEPDQKSMGCPPEGNATLSPDRYLTMWNAVTVRMRAVDRTIKLVGPTTSHADTGEAPDYLGAILKGAIHQPDVVSFHGYGGWRNAQDDRSHFDGGRESGGLEEIVAGLARVRERAPGVPVWITELNVSSAYEADDPAARPWGAFGTAWGASAFLRLTQGGADAIYQYQFAHPLLRQLSLVEIESGRPLLPYWRDYYLSRYFPPGSALLSSRSTHNQIETLAARPPNSNNVHVLVVNRQVGSSSGVPASVEVRVTNLTGTSSVARRILDGSTPLDVGPAAVRLPTANTATVEFSGYGVALIEFVAGSPPLAGATTPSGPTAAELRATSTRRYRSSSARAEALQS